MIYMLKIGIKTIFRKTILLSLAGWLKKLLRQMSLRDATSSFIYFVNVSMILVHLSSHKK